MNVFVEREVYNKLKQLYKQNHNTKVYQMIPNKIIHGFKIKDKYLKITL